MKGGRNMTTDNERDLTYCVDEIGDLETESSDSETEEDVDEEFDDSGLLALGIVSGFLDDF